MMESKKFRFLDLFGLSVKSSIAINAEVVYIWIVFYIGMCVNWKFRALETRSVLFIFLFHSTESV